MRTQLLGVVCFKTELCFGLGSSCYVSVAACLPAWKHSPLPSPRVMLSRTQLLSEDSFIFQQGLSKGAYLSVLTSSLQRCTSCFLALLKDCLPSFLPEHFSFAALCLLSL